MQKIKSVFFVLLTFAFVLAACSAQPTQVQPTLAPTTIVDPASTQISGNLPQTEADVPRISIEDARVAFESGAAIVVDVRSPSAFETSHVAGAISVPLGQIERDLPSVPLNKDQWIITYCTWPDEHQSARAAFILLHSGYTRVEALLGGFAAWVDAGLPVEP